MILLPSSAAAQTIGQSVTIPLQGFAWSGYTNSKGSRVGVGWIAMNGVEMRHNGWLHGYAWSDNIGWIQFGSLSGFPNGGGTQPQNARILPNGQMHGWARACAGTAGGDCSSMADNPDAGGWDGWISLRGNGGSASGYGVRFSTTQQPDGSYEIATGRVGDSYAWGGPTVMGWIDFTQVTLGGTPTPVGTDYITATDCTVPVGASTCNTAINWDASSYGNPRVTINHGVGDVFGAPPATTGSNSYALSGAHSSYTVTLREGGTTIDDALVQVNCSGMSAWDAGSGSCRIPSPDKPDLVVQSLDISTGSYNVRTGQYSNVDFDFRLRNIGATTTAFEGETSVEWDLDYADDERPTNGSDNGSTPAINNGSQRTVSAGIGTLMFGTYTATAEADPSDDIDEEVEGNNVMTVTRTILPQDPSMVLSTLNSQIVRSGEPAVIQWDTVAEYPMNCTLSGPGIPTQSFDPSVAGTTGTVTTSDRFNTSIYTLSCDVIYPGISAIFNAATRVEVIPRLEEI